MPASVQLLANTKEIQKALAAVLAKWTNDSKYYKVDVLSCDQIKRQCRVRFEDKSEHVINCEDMHLQLNLEWLTDKYIVCAVCDNGSSDHPNSIIMCDVCCQGFHVRCHKPQIKELYFANEDIVWQCSTCNAMIKEATKKSKESSLGLKQKSSPEASRKSKAEQKLQAESGSESEVETQATAKKPPRKASKNVKQTGEKPRKKARQEKATATTVADKADSNETKLDKEDEKEQAPLDAVSDDAATQENLVVSNEVEVVTSEDDDAIEKRKKAAPDTKDKKRRKVAPEDKSASELERALDTRKFLNQIATKKDVQAA